MDTDNLVADIILFIVFVAIAIFISYIVISYKVKMQKRDELKRQWLGLIKKRDRLTDHYLWQKNECDNPDYELMDQLKKEMKELDEQILEAYNKLSKYVSDCSEYNEDDLF